ncbi:MAG: 3-deoxy-D-manno-octulosonic acid transferase [Betaproteobacteria bacterium HGW-Betaproteobacteria-1]|jgi:3-deoxy-D-manno-octulosonic-acid transferase|nr:MAG: 3-deoxy-D-manno-octulosonic acid transferase [Betaproteobacteria bacterium HGW-Betaproteobacteria-1]
MSRFFYSLLLYVLLPFTPLKLLWRGMRQPEYRQHLAERYGFYATKPQQPVIWLHCVSLGETRAAAPLVQALMTQYPQHRILLTHATPTGREAGEQLFGDRVDRVYLPYDTPDAVARFLNHFRPAIGLLLETELWFNLIAGCKVRDIPLLLVNARLSEHSARGYGKVANLTRQGLQDLTAIAAQTEQDAARFRQLGAAQVTVCGNLKFDVQPPASANSAGVALRALFGERPVFLAASTRDGEESLILDALRQLQIPGLLTVIVPRHPQRFDDVAVLLQKRGLRFARKSSLVAPLPADVEVLLGDSMGEMFTYYAACDLAFIGGSLLPLGGQNLIEACAMGKPVLIGPHTFNFEQASEQAIAHGAGLRVMNPGELTQALQKLLSNQTMYQRMSVAAQNFSQSATGATGRIVALIDTYVK